MIWGLVSTIQRIQGESTKWHVTAMPVLISLWSLTKDIITFCVLCFSSEYNQSHNLEFEVYTQYIHNLMQNTFHN